MGRLTGIDTMLLDLVRNGNLVTANIALGRVQRMTRDGQAATVLEEVDGQRTPAPTSCSTTAPGGCG